MATVGTSSSWQSPQAEKKAKLERIHKNAEHYGLINSPWFPKNVKDYLEHEKEIGADAMAKQKEAIEYRESLSTIEGAEAINHDHSIKVEDRFRKQKDKPKVNTAMTTEDLRRIQNGDKLYGKDTVTKKMFSVLGEKTTIWNSSYTNIPTRDPNSKLAVLTRAAWPDIMEFKAEGEQRVTRYDQRRLPLPRINQYSQEAIQAKAASDVTMAKLVGDSGSAIPWYQKAVARFEALDRLAAVEAEIASDKKMWSEYGVEDTPIGQNRSAAGTSRNTPTLANQAFQYTGSLGPQSRQRCGSNNFGFQTPPGLGAVGNAPAPAPAPALGYINSNTQAATSMRDRVAAAVLSQLWGTDGTQGMNNGVYEGGGKLGAEEYRHGGISTGEYSTFGGRMGAQEYEATQDFQASGGFANSQKYGQLDSQAFAGTPPRPFSTSSQGYLASAARAISGSNHPGKMRRQQAKLSKISSLGQISVNSSHEIEEKRKKDEDRFDKYTSEWNFMKKMGFGDLMKSL